MKLLNIAGMRQKSLSGKHLRLVRLDGIGLERLLLDGQLQSARVFREPGFGFMDDVAEHLPDLKAGAAQPIERDLHQDEK